MLSEIFKEGFRRFAQGARSAPREFFVPAVVLWRGVRFVFGQLEDAMRGPDTGQRDRKVDTLTK